MHFQFRKKMCCLVTNCVFQSFPLKYLKFFFLFIDIIGHLDKRFGRVVISNINRCDIKREFFLLVFKERRRQEHDSMLLSWTVQGSFSNVTWSGFTSIVYTFMSCTQRYLSLCSSLYSIDIFLNNFLTLLIELFSLLLFRFLVEKLTLA